MAERGIERGRSWTRDETLVAFNLYLRLPYGKLHQGNPDIIALAARLGRTPGSVGYRLNNFASLDPIHQQRGIKGLQNVSHLDRQGFEEFAADWPRLAIESEDARERLAADDRGIALPGDDEAGPPDELGSPPAGADGDNSGRSPFRLPLPRPVGEGRGEGYQPYHSYKPPPSSTPAPDTRPTEAFATVRQRRLQGLFRDAVLAAYDCSCCISGICLPQLLQASHIIPWAADESRRLTPTNGLALSALHDRAFDRGLITLDEDLRVVVSGRLRVGAPSEIYRVSLLEIEGRAIRLPTRWAPDAARLAA